MIKMRLTFVDNKAGNEELKEAIQEIKQSFEVLNISRVYKGRNGSQYSNIYLDVEVRKEDL